MGAWRTPTAGLRLAGPADAQVALRSQRRLGLRLSRPRRISPHYKLLIVPALYIADDALLQRISDYVKNGGHVVMTFKSGFANENSAVRWVRAPGRCARPPASATRSSPISKIRWRSRAIRSTSAPTTRFAIGPSSSCPSTPKPIAYYDHPFFGKWPAITENEFGAGTLLYEGTYLSDALQTAVLRGELDKLGLTGPDQQLPAAVHVQHGVNRLGKRLHYYFNYSGTEVKVTYAYAAGTNLLDGKPVANAAVLTLGPWDLAIVEE